MYVSVRFKFILSILFFLLWLSLSIYFSSPWIIDLSHYVGMGFAIFIVSFIALIPGAMNAFVMIAFVLDKRPKIRLATTWPGVSVLVPAYNEETCIQSTIEGVLRQNYLGPLQLVVVDNGSTDNTLSILNNMNLEEGSVIQELNQGKSFALNTGLANCRHDYVVTIDADTYIRQDGVTELMQRMLSAPSETAAVAGSIYVRNSRKNRLTRIEEWDYFLAIAAIKRIQSLFQATLVAQGAFSLFKKSCIENVGGWSHAVGEDIVLTWGFLEQGYRVDFTEKAFAFTSVPENYRTFFYQRSRWARGMLEAFRRHPRILIRARWITFLVYWNVLFPLIDLTYVFIFIPGIIAAFFGHFFIVGPMTLAILPVSFLMNMVFVYRQFHVYKTHGLVIRKNKSGFIYYMLFYSFLMAPACIHGYFLEFLSMKKTWGTK